MPSVQIQARVCYSSTSTRDKALTRSGQTGQVRLSHVRLPFRMALAAAVGEMPGAFPSTHCQFELYSSNNSKSSLWTSINTPPPFSESDSFVNSFRESKNGHLPIFIFFFTTLLLSCLQILSDHESFIFFSMFPSFFSILFFCVCGRDVCWDTFVKYSSRISIWNIVEKLSCKSKSLGKSWNGLFFLQLLSSCC